MTNPNNQSRMPGPKDAQVTGIAPATKGVISGLTSEYDLPVEATATEYKREPLFSRKVMIGWAALALGAWIAVKVIVPAVFETTKASVVEAIKAAEADKAAGRPSRSIRIERNGRTITITTDQPTASTPAPVTAPAPVPAPAVQAPAILPEPATKKR